MPYIVAHKKGGNKYFRKHYKNPNGPEAANLPPTQAFFKEVVFPPNHQLFLYKHDQKIELHRDEAAARKLKANWFAT